MDKLFEAAAVEKDAARQSLQALNASTNGVDELRYLFVTSQVRASCPDVLLPSQCSNAGQPRC